MSTAMDLEQKKAIIMQQSCFAKFNPDEIEMLAGMLSEKYFAPGETVVKEGEPVDSAFLIVKGTTEVLHERIQDGELRLEHVTFIKEGQAIGLDEAGFYSVSGIRTATVVAVTEVVALRLSVTEFHGFSLEYPHVNEVIREQARKFLNYK